MNKEIGKKNTKTKKKKFYKLNQYKQYGSLLFYTFFIFLFFKTKGIKAKEDQIFDLNEQKKLFNTDLIKENPHLVTDYILTIVNNCSRLNLTLFDKNVNKIKEKIKQIIKYKQIYKNLYLILSSIYGAFLADALGSSTEFMQKDKNNHLHVFEGNGIFKPGQVTDDSEMAMSQAFAILDTYQYKTLNPNLLYYYYVLWYKSNPLDIGMATRNALSFLDIEKVNINDENIFSEKIKSKISTKNSGSLANGFLMRASPLLTWLYMVHKDYIRIILESNSSSKYFGLYKKIHEEMAKDTQLTHPNPETAVAGSIMIFMGLCSMQQKYTGKEILEKVNILFENNYFDDKSNEMEYKIKNHFKSVLNEFSNPNFSKDKFFGDLYYQMGFYKHAFNLTLYYLNVFDEQKKVMSLKDIYNNMMYDISDFGGDTDTNGAIVGMIMGPLIGMENFDGKYFEPFLSFYDRERLIYTNVLMYFYAKYLETIENNAKIVEKDKYDVNYYYIKIIIKMLNSEMNLQIFE